MKLTRILWDMPIIVEIRDEEYQPNFVEDVYAYFRHVDDLFNTYKPLSEISHVNRGEIAVSDWSKELAEVVALCEETRRDSQGYFSHIRSGEIHPLGLVKGWAIHNAANELRRNGVRNFYIDAGGDVEICGCKARKTPWCVGIRNPFDRGTIVKKLTLADCGIATSGTYIRGYHIYNPIRNRAAISDIVSLTVIGPNAYEADRFATAAFAMGEKGIAFIASLPGLEGYQIDARGIATYTNGFDRYVNNYGHHRID